MGMRTITGRGRCRELDVVVVVARCRVGAGCGLLVKVVRFPGAGAEQAVSKVPDLGLEPGGGAERLDAARCPARGRGYLAVVDAQGVQHAGRAQDERRVDVGGFQFPGGLAERGEGLIDPPGACAHRGQVELGPGPA